MGRRFQERYLNQGRQDHCGAPLRQVSGGIRTVVLDQDNIKEQHCPLCDGVYFRQLVRIFAMPQILSGSGTSPAGGQALAFVAVMSCRGCGWIMPNENTPPAVLEHGRLRSCGECGCECHEQCFGIGKISRLIIGTDRDRIIMREAYFCARCGKMFEVERRGAATVGEKQVEAEG